MKFRKNAGLTHQEVAILAGIERSTYTKAENGFPVSIATAKAISNVFNINWILFFEDNCDEKGQFNKKSISTKIV